MSDYEEYGSCGDDDECPWDESDVETSDDESDEDITPMMSPEFRDERDAYDRAGKTALQMNIDSSIDDIKEAFGDSAEVMAARVAIARSQGKRIENDSLPLIMNANVGVNFPTYDELKHVNVCACMLAWSPRMIAAMEGMKTGDIRIFDNVVKELQEEDGIVREVLLKHLTGEKGLKNIPYILVRYHRWMKQWQSAR